MNDDRCLFHKTLGARISLWTFWGLFLKFFRWRQHFGGRMGRRERAGLSAISRKRGLVAASTASPMGELELPFLSNVTDCIVYG